jgi:hypothetical protein
MAEHSETGTRPGDEDRVALRGFFLQAVLWLPMMFFLWFALRSPVVFPVTRSVKALMESWLAGLVIDVGQEFHTITYAFVVRIQGVPGIPDAPLEIGAQYTNVLMYCYGLPLLFGLIMATPLNWRRTFLQMGVGYLVLLPMQVFGVAGDILKTLAFGVRGAVEVGLGDAGFGAQAVAAGIAAERYVHGILASKGLGLDAIALIYQFGYLILPSVVPIALWIAMNRGFIEGLLARPEPRTAAVGLSAAAPEAAPPSDPREP